MILATTDKFSPATWSTGRTPAATTAITEYNAATASVAVMMTIGISRGGFFASPERAVIIEAPATALVISAPAWSSPSQPPVIKS